MYKVTLIPGDGVGPEIAEATRKCVDATGVKIEWDVQDCGIEVIQAEGKVPDRVLKSIRANKVASKAPITTPDRQGFPQRQRLPAAGAEPVCLRAPVQALQRGADLFQRLEGRSGPRPREHGRPVRRRRVQGRRARDGAAHRRHQQLATGKKIGDRRETTGISIKPISVRRDAARSPTTPSTMPSKHSRKSVTSVCKANIMKFTDGLWYDETRAVALAYGAKFEWPDLAEGVKARSAARRQGEVDQRLDRLRRAADRQHVHAARAEAGRLRRDRHVRTCTAIF